MMFRTHNTQCESLRSIVKNQRRAFRWVFGFSLLLVGANQLVRLPQVMDAISHGRLQLYRERLKEAHHAKPDANVYLFGNSRVFYGLDPVPLQNELSSRLHKDVRIWNYALTASVPEADAFLFEEILSNHDLPPEAVFLEISDVSLSLIHGGKEDALRFFYSPAQLPQLLKEGRYDDTLTLLTYELLPAYRYRLYIKERLQGIVRTDDHLVRGFYAGGHPARSDQAKAQRLELDYLESLLVDFEPAEAQVNALRHFLNLAREKGIRVILFSMPVSPPLLDYCEESGASERFSRFTRSLSAEYNLPYLSYLTHDNAIRYTWQDCSHIGSESLELFAQRLGVDTAPFMSEK